MKVKVGLMWAIELFLRQSGSWHEWAKPLGNISLFKLNNNLSKLCRINPKCSGRNTFSCFFAVLSTLSPFWYCHNLSSIWLNNGIAFQFPTNASFFAGKMNNLVSVKSGYPCAYCIIWCWCNVLCLRINYNKSQDNLVKYGEGLLLSLKLLYARSQKSLLPKLQH